MRKLTDDLAAPWFLELWIIAPTPVKARQLRKPTVERLLRQHRIRRVDADAVLCTLREPAIKVADGVAEAASIHLRSLVARLRVVNRELRAAEDQLEKFCTSVRETEAASGECLRRQDILILRSMPGIGRINLAALLCEASFLVLARQLWFPAASAADLKAWFFSALLAGAGLPLVIVLSSAWRASGLSEAKAFSTGP